MGFLFIGIFKYIYKNIYITLFEDKRADNTTIPFNLLQIAATATKMKGNTALSDIPYAFSDHTLVSRLGYNIVDTECKLKDMFTTESSIRAIIDKYAAEDFFDAYRNFVQKHVYPKIDIRPNIHIVDGTEISVNLSNENYENSEVVTRGKKGTATRGYKLSALVGITPSGVGIIEDFCFGGIRTHDVNISNEMLRTTPVIKPRDILIFDQGFLDRDLLNFIKFERKADVYVPLKRHMIAFKKAVKVAKDNNEWENHPNSRYSGQVITGMPISKSLWVSEKASERTYDASLNVVVVWDKEATNEEYEYRVFATTDTTATAQQILNVYVLRAKIEEDYRQLKAEWKLEDFKSTKYNRIAFHIVSTLYGYLFWNFYKMMDAEGKRYTNTSLPSVIKNYPVKALPFVVIYAGDEFAILSINALYTKIYPKCSKIAQKRIEKFFSEERLL